VWEALREPLRIVDLVAQVTPAGPAPEHTLAAVEHSVAALEAAGLIESV
jgi:hypothetical protein